MGMKTPLLIFLAFAVVYVASVVLVGGDGMVVGAGLLVGLVLAVLVIVPAVRLRGHDGSR